MGSSTSARSLLSLSANKRTSSPQNGNHLGRQKENLHLPRKVRPAFEGTLPVTPATAGDHHAVHEFLISVFHAPTRDAFLAALDDPFYEPSDRQIVRCGLRVIAHAQVTKRVMRLGPLALPVANLWSMGTLPEHRGQGYARRVLAAAQHEMSNDGALLGLLRTSVPKFFRAAGWAVCGRHSRSQARTRDVLAQLVQSSPADNNSPEKPLPARVRPWRQVELPALMRLYAEHSARVPGAIERSEAYWRWLISCKRFDQIFVAVHGPDRHELDDTRSPIVGYVVTRDDEVLELVTHSEHPAVGPCLLARACGESVERDLHNVAFYAPPNDPMHEVFRQAGGTHVWHEVHQGEVGMVKVFDRWQLLRQLAPLLHERAECAGLARPCELGLWIACDDKRYEKYHLSVSRRSVKICRDNSSRCNVRLNDAEFTRMVLGHLDLSQALLAGRVLPSTRAAAEIAQTLFPCLPLWRSPWDDRMD